MWNKKSTSLKAEISKAAKLSNIQGGLPPIMRGLPVMAVLAGEAIAKATDGRNIIEERILGADEAVFLSSPPPQSSVSVPPVNHSWARPGVQLMCQSCGRNSVQPSARARSLQVAWKGDVEER